MGLLSLLWGCTDRCVKPDLHLVNGHPFRLWAEQTASSGRSVLRGTGPGAPPGFGPLVTEATGMGQGQGGRESCLRHPGLVVPAPGHQPWRQSPRAQLWTVLDPVSEEVLLPDGAPRA